MNVPVATLQTTANTPKFVMNNLGNIGLNTVAPADQLQVVASAVPTTDQVNITNAGQGITTTSVNNLSLFFVGGAAAIESASERIDVTPGSTSGGTWSGLRFVANATGPATGVIESGLKLDAPTTGGAGTYNGVYVNGILPASGGTANGINIVGSTAAAGTENGINIGAITAGAGTQNALMIGTGWNASIVFGDGATVAAGVKGTIKMARESSASATCASGTAQGLVFKNDAGTQIGHFCTDSAGTLKIFAAAVTTGTDVAEKLLRRYKCIEAGRYC